MTSVETRAAIGFQQGTPIFNRTVVMLKLYYSTGSCALAAHIALEEANADYEAIRISLKDGDQRKPEYLAMNPKGRVPVLITDRGVLTENVAILAFIAQSHPQANLAPLDDPFGFAKVQAFNSYLSSTLHVAHAHKGRGSRWVDDAAAMEAMKKKVPQTVGDCFAMIENEMFEGPWVIGSQYRLPMRICTRWRRGWSSDRGPGRLLAEESVGCPPRCRDEPSARRRSRWTRRQIPGRRTGRGGCGWSSSTSRRTPRRRASHWST